MAGLAPIGDLSHAMESLIDIVSEGLVRQMGYNATGVKVQQEDAHQPSPDHGQQPAGHRAALDRQLAAQQMADWIDETLIDPETGRGLSIERLRVPLPD